MRECRVIALAVAAMLLFPAVASAKQVKFLGSPDDGAGTAVSFVADGHQRLKRVEGRKVKGRCVTRTRKNRRKKRCTRREREFRAETVSDIKVLDQPFACFSGKGSYLGISGRQTYHHYAFIPPIDVTKSGRFSGSYTYTISGTTHIPDLLKFKGRIERSRHAFHGVEATGTYQSKRSEVDIRLAYCGDIVPVKWAAQPLR